MTKMSETLTLIIPAHNRPRLFAALLSYLKAKEVDWHILVLDSSRPEGMDANHATASRSGLDIQFLTPIVGESAVEKWRRGVGEVKTPYCLLCADDDLIVVEGIRQSLDLLQKNPSASVVQGFSFTFLPLSDGNIELNNVAYFTPSITQDTPLERLAQLFQQYQATVYGLYRAPVLKKILDSSTELTSILSRELLWSALSVVEGSAIRIPVFTNGRSMGASEFYVYWHPLEWLSKSPEGLLQEYRKYRCVLARSILSHSENSVDTAHVERILDLIHLHYLVKHAPDSALGFIIDQQFDRVSFKEYWPDHKIHLPLYEAAGIGARDLTNNGLKPVNVSGRDRTYAVLPNFYAAIGMNGLTFETVVKLIAQLDDYKVEVGRAATAAEPVNEAG